MIKLTSQTLLFPTTDGPMTDDSCKYYRFFDKWQTQVLRVSNQFYSFVFPELYYCCRRTFACQRKQIIQRFSYDGPSRANNKTPLTWNTRTRPPESRVPPPHVCNLWLAGWDKAVKPYRTTSIVVISCWHHTWSTCVQQFKHNPF